MWADNSKEYTIDEAAKSINDALMFVKDKMRKAGMEVWHMEKKVLSTLEKCYSIAPLSYKGRQHILVAAEKKDRCIMFDADGNEEQTVWEGPGGVMTMVQVPDTDGQFLATHKFYSPNDSKEAKIVLAFPKEDGEFEIRTLAELPFVHRFDILKTKIII